MRFKSSGLFPFRLIRTGIRCSTFTKFPVALSCGIIEKAAPVASEMDSTTPFECDVRHGVCGYFHFCTFFDIRKLGFAVIGDYPQITAVYDINHSLSRLHQLPFRISFFPVMPSHGAMMTV